jgi:hypothetical protein
MEGLAAVRKKIEDAFNEARSGTAPIVNHPRKSAPTRPLAERATFWVRASEIAASRLPDHSENDRRIHNVCAPTETAEELYALFGSKS